MDTLPDEVRYLIFQQRRKAQARDFLMSQMRKPMSKISVRHTLWAFQNCEYDFQFRRFVDYVLDWHNVWQIYYH